MGAFIGERSGSEVGDLSEQSAQGEKSQAVSATEAAVHCSPHLEDADFRPGLYAHRGGLA